MKREKVCTGGIQWSSHSAENHPAVEGYVCALGLLLNQLIALSVGSDDKRVLSNPSGKAAGVVDVGARMHF